jgi:hypothetical protein
MITIAAEHLKLWWVAIVAGKAPKSCSTRSKIVCPAVGRAVAFNVVKLKETNIGCPTAGALAVGFAATVVAENFISQPVVVCVHANSVAE